MTADSFIRKTRRGFLSELGFVTAAVLASSYMRSAEATAAAVSGRVLRCDLAPGLGDAGIGGVMVSNGKDVVVTDAAGRWELPASAGDTIFVIKPAHWTYAESQGIASFSRRVPALPHSGPIDFHLKPQAESTAFDVALVADTQASNGRELDYVRRELAAGLGKVAPVFAIHHGDVMGDDLDLLVDYRNIVTETGLLWHHCPGNHDLDLAAADTCDAFDTWKREIGPPHYAFQYSGATFLVLNNVEYFGKGAAPIEGRLYRGRIGDDQLAFVRNVLQHVSKDQLIVVSMHIPLVSFENPDCAADNTSDRRELMRILSGFPHTVSFSGHSHTTEHHYLDARDGYQQALPHHHHVLTAFCGSWWGGPLDGRGIPVSDSRDGSPRGFHMLRVEGNAYQTRFVPLGDVADAELRVDVRASATEPGAVRQVFVDVFDGGPRTHVRGYVEGAAAAVEFVRAKIPDPHIVESFARYRDLLRPWVSAAPSSHMWMVTLPEGTSSCNVEVVGEYGAGMSRTIVV